MMKRTVFSLILAFLLALPTILFQSCPITSEAKREEKLLKAEWAVNKPGKISVELSDLDTFIEYNTVEGFNNTYPVICKSYIYTGEGKTYTINYRILSSVMPGEVLGSCELEEAEYDSIKKNVFPMEKESIKYELKIPAGLEAINNVNIVIEYNISELFTKIKIPATLRKPPTGSTSSLETLISYTSSPIVPKSDKIKIDITSKSAIFYLDIIDAEKCFEGYRRQPPLRIGNEIIVNAVIAGKKIDGISCTPTTINTLPATLRCSIDLTKNNEIYQLFASETGVYMEVDLVLKYTCSMRNMYNIQIVRQV
ncbi:MAG: hypothetical protein QW184_01100 [Nanopusillaceae archaeon]